jgi:hypothetical protein
MVGIGVIGGTLGYGVFYYGAKLWTRQPQSLAYAFGFSKVNTAAATAAKNAAAGETSSPTVLSPWTLLSPLGSVLGVFH